MKTSSALGLVLTTSTLPTWAVSTFTAFNGTLLNSACIDPGQSRASTDDQRIRQIKDGTRKGEVVIMTLIATSTRQLSQGEYLATRMMETVF